MPNIRPNDIQDVILDSITEGVFTVDSNWRITSFNRAAEEITGVDRKKAIGRQCRDILRADVCESGCALAETIRTGQAIIGRAVHIIDANGKRRAIAISTALLKDQNGEVIGGVETIRDMTVVEELRKELEGRYSCEDIISQDHRMQELFRTIGHIAESDCTVLIEGESGTGKELVARAIHNLSLRKNKHFVAVNCGALPDSLLESELFGYKAGAFTDAKKDKPGRFALAEGGTLFLDEIGDVSAAMQVRLLRVLQEHTYEPLGAVESAKTNVRIIAATNKKLSELIEHGKFRDDLYYRINVIRLELPPLRDRKGDIPLLVDYFISRLNRLRGKSISCVTNDVLACLLSYDYPGNVRELENILEHCFVLCRGEVIQREHLPISVFPPIGEGKATAGETKTLKQVEVMLIIEALRRSKGNQTAASHELGINKSTLYRKLKAYNIKPEAYS
ncbi:MAG: sigma 54-interacting transcriptional regulator [Sedimentisphaerales bacterium]|nr:sigma 54-interacting transcriptional regulator [Sedimentisphaerales bacterium]